MKTQLVLALVAVSVAATAASAAPKEETWTAIKDAKWTPLDPSHPDGPQFSVVFGDMKKKAPIGFLLKMPAGFKPGPHTHSSDDYAVVIQGTAHNFKAPGTDVGPGLTAGGSWFQPANQPHDNECEASSKDGCIVYVVMPNGFDFKPYAEPKKK